MGSPQYKIKLRTGRVLGPLDLERIRALIRKNQIIGLEVARKYPDGNWQDINLIADIANLLLENVQKDLFRSQVTSSSHYQPLLGSRGIEGQGAAAGTTMPIAPETQLMPDPQVEPGREEPPPEKTVIAFEDPERTVATRTARATDPSPDTDDATCVGSLDMLTRNEPSLILQLDDDRTSVRDRSQYGDLDRSIANEETIVFARGRKLALPPFLGGKRAHGVPVSRRGKLIRALGVAAAVTLVALELLAPDDPRPVVTRVDPLRPKLPAWVDGHRDPVKSAALYKQGLKYYLADNVFGYRKSADFFFESASLDPDNVRSTALLASSYLNLIDSSNKDEKYFAVISKLIDLTRAKGVELPETVIADVEFFLTVNKPEAAQNRIVEYTKTQRFGLEMFYYLALALYQRGSFADAAQYLSHIPEKNVFSSKVFYLRGQLAEKLGDPEAALAEYKKGIAYNSHHARSRLRVAALLNDMGHLGEAGEHLESIVEHPQLLSPQDLSAGYYLHALYSELKQKWDIALGDLERAVKLDPQNHDYLLELYTLRAKAGETSPGMRKEARMFYYLGEGERLAKQGKYHEGLVQFLQAHEQNPGSPLPFMKLGDMFVRLNDLTNARLNYKSALDRAPNNIGVGAKYMDVLIQSYEWDEAEKAMDHFRRLPVNQSAIDKAAADMYEKQGRHEEAQRLYRKAMGRESIDPGVYLAYANSLAAVKDYADAPFFYALALRYDPLNTDAIIGTAKCVAQTDSVERAISLLQDELQKGGAARAELLGAIAEFQVQTGNWNQAQQNIDQAMSVNPDYAYPWKLQAQIYLNRDINDRKALDKVLSAYQSYSDRNSSDPSGYLERYRIFIRKTDYEKAAGELDRIFAIYPKYPSLHFFKGALYAIQGNHKLAIGELRTELANTPNNIEALIALGKEFIELSAAEEALKVFSRAMQVAPQLPEAKSQAGYANYLLKNYAAAVALYNAAIALDPGNPMLYKRLGMAYRDMGDGPNSQQAFQKYLQMEPDASDREQVLRIH